MRNNSARVSMCKFWLVWATLMGVLGQSWFIFTLYLCFGGLVVLFWFGVDAFGADGAALRLAGRVALVVSCVVCLIGASWFVEGVSLIGSPAYRPIFAQQVGDRESALSDARSAPVCVKNIPYVYKSDDEWVVRCGRFWRPGNTWFSSSR